MTLPRLRAELHREHEVARVLRGALRHEIAVVPLARAPSSAGQHLLEIAVPGNQPVVLLADPVGDPTAQGQPLHVRPITREQMATLLGLVEQLDDIASRSAPPDFDASGLAVLSGDEGEDDDATIVDPVVFITPHGDTAPPAAPAAAESLLPPPPPSSAPRPSVPPAHLREHAMIGRIIGGKYRLESVIGSGASAVVFRAEHVDLGRPVAVKVLHEQNRGESQFVKRFKAEALAASKLEHPNVTRIMELGEDGDGVLFIVMELLVGRSLEAILAAGGRLDPVTTLTIGMQICSALAAAHDRGIIHRDVKPENVVLVSDRDDDGNTYDLVKVCDFGLAKLRAEAGQGELTMAGMLCGSPAYMSPEQTRGDELDARTDVYSLGVTLYEALTAALPHEATTLAELFFKKTVEAPRAPSSLAPAVTPELDEVVLRALATDRTTRHANARALRDDLRNVLRKLSAE